MKKDALKNATDGIGRIGAVKTRAEISIRQLFSLNFIYKLNRKNIVDNLSNLKNMRMH